MGALRDALQRDSTAERALSAIDEAGRHTAGYHAVAALLAQARKREDQAETEWAQAAQLAPNEKVINCSWVCCEFGQRTSNYMPRARLF